MMHTHHTTLMRVISSGRNRAKFLIAHPFMIDRSTEFENRKFGLYPTGSLIVATFRASVKTRHILRVSAFPGTETDFATHYADQLKTEAEQFVRTASSWPEPLKAKWSVEHASRAVKLEPTRPLVRETPVTELIVEEAERMDEKPGSDYERAPEPTPAVDYVQTEKKTSPYKAAPRKIVSGWIGEFYMTPSLVEIVNSVVNLAESRPVNVLAIGRSGYGKTSFAKAIADVCDMKLLRMNCASVRDPEEWFGWREARDGDTIFVPTEFTETVRGGNAVIILDEFNRVEPWLHNTLYPLLDHDRKTTVHGEEVVVGPRTLFIATINHGAEFVGTFTMDRAMMNRFDVAIQVGPLSTAVEVTLLTSRTSIENRDAEKIVAAMTKLRDVVKEQEIDIDPSTRSSIKISELFVASGGKMKMKDIFGYVLCGGLDPKDAKIVIDATSAIFA